MSPQQPNGTRRNQSPEVYRRRRAVVFGGLIVIVALLAWAIFGIASLFRPGSTTPATTPAAASSASAPVKSATSAPPATPTCDESQVVVTGATDKQAYAATDKEVKLTLKVANNGAVACNINVGTSQMEFLVSSGQDRIFSSKDCQSESKDLMKTIEPGKSETSVFVWQRNRTTAGCQVVNSTPGGGGATYVYQAILGDRTSPKVIFTLQ